MHENLLSRLFFCFMLSSNFDSIHALDADADGTSFFLSETNHDEVKRKREFC